MSGTPGLPGFGPVERWIVGAALRRLIPAAVACTACDLARDVTAPGPFPPCPRCGAPQALLRTERTKP